MLYLLSRINRSRLIKAQSQHPEYATFTPIIALGLKRSQNIKYEFWRGFTGREWIIEPRLLQAIDVQCPTLGSDRLLEIRDQGLSTKSGKNAGTKKSVVSTWALYGIQDTELGHLPKLTQTMLTQCWITHPTKRTGDMILDPLDWDHIPPPLVTAEIFEQPNPKPITAKPRQALPWD